MKFFIFRDDERKEVMINIELISSISVDMDGTVRVISANGGFYKYRLPDNYRLNRDVYITKFYNTIRRATTQNNEIFAITADDVMNETITTI